MATIAFIGLGVMGYPMARHLLAAGHQLQVFNRTHAKAARFAGEEGGRACNTVREAVSGADALVTCVGNDGDVGKVTAAAFPHMRDGSLYIDHTTASARLARRIAEENPRLLCVDAPVSGGQSGAEEGTLSVMCGGSATALVEARPLMQVYAKRITHVGPAGHGQLAKMANQIAVAGVIESLAEALHFSRKAGLDPKALLQAIGGGAAQSWQMDNRAETMLAGAFSFGFAVDLMRKDLGLVLEEAARNGASLPVTALIDQFYKDVQKMGGGRNDTSALIRRLS